MTKKELINQIKSEIRFLQSQGIKDLVHDADIGCCHEDYPYIDNRIKKLKKDLTRLRPRKD